MSLAGKTVLITGGSSGMGFASAQALAAAGASVWIASRSEKRLQDAAARLGKGTRTSTLDVTCESEVKAFFEKCDPFDHLVTCAAGTAMGFFAFSETAPVRDYFESKFWGQYLTARYGSQKIRPGGSITLFSGAANKKATAMMTPSAAINGAIEGLARTLAQELAPIRVNVVSPGLIDTELHAGMPADQKAGLFAMVAQSLPIKRVGLPEDAARAVLFLIECEYATGSVVSVDGGYSAI
ncbi:MAG: SDR family oxidoreductase [bacterium]